MSSPLWRRRFAAWAIDPEPGATTTGAVILAADRLDRVMKREGAIELEPRSFTTTSSRPGFFERGEGIVLAEVEGLILRHPVPIPPIDLFPRLSRLFGRGAQLP